MIIPREGFGFYRKWAELGIPKVFFKMEGDRNRGFVDATLEIENANSFMISVDPNMTVDDIRPFLVVSLLKILFIIRTMQI